MITDDNQDVYINVCLVVLSNCHTVTQSHSYGEILSLTFLRLKGKHSMTPLASSSASRLELEVCWRRGVMKLNI